MTAIVIAVVLGLGACQNPAATGGAGSPAGARSGGGRLSDGPARDLSQDERAGGHVLRKHVGLTDDELRQRLEREEDISGASTYTDRRTAEQVVGAAIAQSQSRIEGWLRRPGRHSNLVLDYDGPEAVGRTINRGESHPRPCSHAVAVLKYVGPGEYYVLTSYPECR